MKHTTIYALLLFVFTAGCGKTPPAETWASLDLLQHGLPITILAPDSAQVRVVKVGVVEDVTVRNAGVERYAMQIYVQPAISSDMTELKAREIEAVKSLAEFLKIEDEDEQSFLYSLRIDGETSYSFRYIHLQADKEYVFTTGFNELFSEEQARRILESARQKRPL